MTALDRLQDLLDGCDNYDFGISVGDDIKNDIRAVLDNRDSILDLIDRAIKSWRHDGLIDRGVLAALESAANFELPADSSAEGGE